MSKKIKKVLSLVMAMVMLFTVASVGASALKDEDALASVFVFAMKNAAELTLGYVDYQGEEAQAKLEKLVEQGDKCIKAMVEETYEESDYAAFIAAYEDCEEYLFTADEVLDLFKERLADDVEKAKSLKIVTDGPYTIQLDYIIELMEAAIAAEEYEPEYENIYFGSSNVIEIECAYQQTAALIFEKRDIGELTEQEADEAMAKLDAAIDEAMAYVPEDTQVALEVALAMSEYISEKVKAVAEEIRAELNAECEDCGRVHSESYDKYICLLISFIRLIEDLIKSLSK